MKQLWDVGASQVLMEYDEHEKRAWSVDFSKADPTKLASGSDDGTVKLWSINQVHLRQSLFCTICHTPGNEPSGHKVKDLALGGLVLLCSFCAITYCSANYFIVVLSCYTGCSWKLGF